MKATLSDGTVVEGTPAEVAEMLAKMRPQVTFKPDEIVALLGNPPKDAVGTRLPIPMPSAWHDVECQMSSAAHGDWKSLNRPRCTCGAAGILKSALRAE